MLIMIDPGHGGTDLGITTEKFVEKFITLEVAKMIGDQLYASGFDTVLPRNGEDKTVAVFDRGIIAKSTNSDAFVSLHFHNEKSKIIYSCRESIKEKSKEIADFIAQEFKRDYNLTFDVFTRESKGLDFFMNLRAVETCPAIMIVINWRDIDEVFSRIHAAECIAKGICLAFGIPYKTESTETVPEEVIQEPESVTPFKDWDLISDKSKSAINTFLSLGILKPDSSGNFNPKPPITKEELVCILYQALNNLKIHI